LFLDHGFVALREGRELFGEAASSPPKSRYSTTRLRQNIRSGRRKTISTSILRPRMKPQVVEKHVAHFRNFFFFFEVFIYSVVRANDVSISNVLTPPGASAIKPLAALSE
jgi:hypothetical protein